MPKFRTAVCCALPAMLAGCATITTGSSQNVTLITEPGGAACVFSRGGEIMGMINPTPGTLMLSKGHGDIRVRCTKEGFLDSSGVVGAKFQKMTFGNILFGGIIGIVVDAASGATGEYEPQITITLVPAQFGSVEERDAFFDRMRKEFASEAEEVRARIRRLCSGADCDRQLALAAEQEKKGDARIETQRQQARIVAKAQPAVATGASAPNSQASDGSD
ncbi:hypothetical protein [Accumulibacter sp.]|uniref:hypothetical protein n=1 Tax=Accumulibacter sp. TaxID=2053492 RepID=UPI0025CEACB2|nr:hypothetical protein [Accumulibacter sp.]MCM8662607.1 hypothetical protein [Accumulibacter sp.]